MAQAAALALAPRDTSPRLAPLWFSELRRTWHGAAAASSCAVHALT
jgi:hypothetical protein